MDAMRADMGGAATVCSAIVTAAALKLPLNIIGKCFCVENQKTLVLEGFVKECFSSISNSNSHVQTSWTLVYFSHSLAQPLFHFYLHIRKLLFFTWIKY